MKSWQRVAIVGVGLMGGSLGLALRERGLAEHVVGIGRREASLAVALQMGSITESSLSLADGVQDAELVVLCTPVQMIVEQAKLVAEHCAPDALITDVGSTKAEIVQNLGTQLARGVRFLGSHPLAGSDRSGPEAAFSSLYQDRLVVLTPTEETPAADVQTLRSFWESVGAYVKEMSAPRHDQAVAMTSHLPHVVAAALSASLPEELNALAASGFRDTTRIAAGGAELWRQILLENAENVVEALSAFEAHLSAFRTAIDQRDSARLTELLTQAKEARDALGN